MALNQQTTRNIQMLEQSQIVDYNKEFPPSLSVSLSVSLNLCLSQSLPPSLSLSVSLSLHTGSIIFLPYYT